MFSQFGRKRCQKKRKDVSYQLLYELFQKKIVVHDRLAVKNSFSTYVWRKVDSCFCEALYVDSSLNSSVFLWVNDCSRFNKGICTSMLSSIDFIFFCARKYHQNVNFDMKHLKTKKSREVINTHVHKNG